VSICEHKIMGIQPPPPKPLVMLGRASNHNCSYASFKEVVFYLAIYIIHGSLVVGSYYI